MCFMYGVSTFSCKGGVQFAVYGACSETSHYHERRFVCTWHHGLEASFLAVPTSFNQKTWRIGTSGIRAWCSSCLATSLLEVGTEAVRLTVVKECTLGFVPDVGDFSRTCAMCLWEGSKGICHAKQLPKEFHLKHSRAKQDSSWVTSV